MDLRSEITRRLQDGVDSKAIIEDLERASELLEGSDRCVWLFELGQYAELLVADRARALGLYQRAWQVAPHPEAIERARWLCLELGQLDELVELVERELAVETGLERRTQLLLLAGEALLDLGEQSRAAGHLITALAGGHSQAVQDALGTASYDDDWRAEVARLKEVADEDPTAAAAQVYLRIARILGMEAPEDPERERMLWRVLDLDPDNPHAHILLDYLLAHAERWDDIERFQTDAAEAGIDAEERSSRYLRYAFRWLGRHKDLSRAAKLCVRALECGYLEAPIAAVGVMRDLLASQRQWLPLVDTLDKVLALPLVKEVEVHVSLLAGIAAWKALRDLPRAQGYFDRVRAAGVSSFQVLDFDEATSAERETISPEQRALMDLARRSTAGESAERAIEAWRKAIAADPQKRGPRRRLAQLLRRNERWRALAEALKEEEAQACSAGPDKISVLLELTEVYRNQLRHDLLVAATLEKVLEISPVHAGALQQLVTHYQGQKRWADMVSSLRRIPPAVTDPAQKLAAHLQAARVLIEPMSKEVEAMRELEAVRALSPLHPEAVSVLDQLYERRREWEKLYSLRRDAFDGAPPADRAERLTRALELARLADDKVKKPALSIAAWSAVTAIAPDHQDALAALEKLYTREQKLAELAEVYRKQIGCTDDPADRAARLQKLALLYTTSLPQPEQAIDAWRELLELVPDNPRAVDALRKLYLQAHRFDDLEAFYAGQGRLAECVRVLERQVADEPPQVRVELWRRIALIYRDALTKPANAQQAFERVLGLDPHDHAAARALIPIYEQAKDSRKLVDVLLVDLQHTTGAAARVNRLCVLGRLAEHDLKEPARAFRFWLQAFEEDPNAPSVRTEVERLTGETGSFLHLIGAYQRAASRVDPPDGALPLLSVVARTQESMLSDRESALETWRKVLVLAPANVEALDALERNLLGLSRYDELQALYTHKLSLESEPIGRRKVQLKIAEMAEAQGDSLRAQAAYLDILRVSGDALPELRALERLYSAASDWARLADALDRQRALQPSAALADICFRLGQLRHKHLDDLAGAIVLYREVLERSPKHEGARAALEELLDHPAHQQQAALVLEPVYVEGDQVQQLVRVREVMVAHATSDDKKVALLSDLAELLERRLDRPEAAFHAAAHALRVDPTRPGTYDRLDRLAARTAAWPALLDVYREVAKRPLGRDQQVDLRCRLGRLYRDHLGDPEKAIATYTRVLDLDGNNAEAAKALSALRAR